jgi:hypothetical protein
MSPRLLKDEKGISPSSKGGGGFQVSEIYESTRDGEGSGPRQFRGMTGLENEIRKTNKTRLCSSFLLFFNSRL